MNCKYIYKGYTFNSEIELDDFLISKKQYESEFGDLVFSKKIEQLDSEKKLKDFRDSSKQFKEAWNYKKKYIDGEEVGKRNKPWKGVTEYLSELKTNEGRPLFPIFDIDNYFSEKIPVWTDPTLNRDIHVIYDPAKKIGVFTQEEIDIMFEGDINKARYLTKEEALRWKEIIQNKWQQQAEMGTAIHAALEYFFSKNANGYYNFTQTDENIKYKIRKTIDLSKLPPNTLDQIITYARELKSKIAKELNEDEDSLEFFPEVTITGDLSELRSDGVNKLAGSIDLAIVGSDGRIHIVDYKTSPKDFIHYSSAKKLAFTYQQATYNRMLQRQGLNVKNNIISIAPIQFDGLKLLNKDEALQIPSKALFAFDQLVWDSGAMLMDLSPTIKVKDSLNEHLDNYMPEVKIVDIPSQEVLSRTTKRMTENFGVNLQQQTMDDEQLRDLLKEEGAFKADENGNYTYHPKSSIKQFLAKSEEDMFNQVRKYYDRASENIFRRTEALIRALQEGQKNNTTDISAYLKGQLTKHLDDENAEAGWYLKYIQQYSNSDWKVESYPEAISFGVIFIRNIHTNQIDVIKLATNNLKFERYYTKGNKKYENRSSLLYQFETDLKEKANSRSYMLQAYNGNLHSMEVMFLINNMAGRFQEGKIGHIQIINPYIGQSMSAKNEELLYCYNKLLQYAPLKNERDFIKEGDINFATTADLAEMDFIATLESQNSISGKSELTSCKSQLQGASSVEEKISALEKIAQTLLSNNSSLLQPTKSMDNKEARIYNKILLAIAELRGYHLRQQIKDHKKFSENSGIGIFTKGWQGSYIDNPGNLESNTLNMITQLVAQGYQGVRTEMTGIINEVRKEMEEFRKAKGFVGTVQNETSLFKNMFRDDITDELILKNPDDLHNGLDEHERKFLSFFLEKVNKRRLNLTDEKLNELKQSGSLEYFRVPLARASGNSEVAMKGLWSYFKHMFGNLIHPSKSLSEFKEKMEGLFSYEEQHQKDTNLFSMTNMFDRTAESREMLVAEKGKEYFEHNLEALLLKHEFAYSTKKHMDNVFPMIKAAYVHLLMQGEFQNTTFKNDLEYAQNYIKAIVKNQHLEEEFQDQVMNQLAGNIKKITSFTALAFSPVQMYQFIQHLWTDLSLYIRKPDGSAAFTKDNLVQAFKYVYKDLGHFSNTPTKVQLLNEIFGVNDMDMNTYVDRVKTDQGGVFNITNFAYKFASRPDFYGRMSIIVAKMINDGSWDAYEVVDGKLVYNFKKDKRFSDIANGKPNMKQEALYRAIGKQLVNEGYTMPDGQPFRMDSQKIVPLPTGYSSQEIESYKNITDTAYGYYTHERKSLIHYQFLGSLFMQMRTYWSGKKNQYMQSGGVKVQGRWEQEVDNNGNKLYYQVIDGRIREDLPPVTAQEGTPEDQLAPFLVWKGQWQEGIIVTIGSIIRDTLNYRAEEGDNYINALKKAYMDKWNVDDADLQRMYRSNIKQLIYDILLFLIIGMGATSGLEIFADSATKKAKETGSVSDGFNASMLNLGTKMVRNSALDFAFWDSIGSPLGSWTPFSIEAGTNILKRWFNAAVGDNTAANAAVNTFTATKVFRPMFENIVPFKEDSDS